MRLLHKQPVCRSVGLSTDWQLRRIVWVNRKWTFQKVESTSTAMCRQKMLDSASHIALTVDKDIDVLAALWGVSGFLATSR